MTLTLFVLDVDDFRPLAEVAAKLSGVEVVKRGPYYEVSSEHAFEIDRGATGCRNAVWFSSVAAVRQGHVAHWDKASLRVVPGSSAPHRPAGEPRPEALTSHLERDVV
jgi:hypothetical protein